MTAMDGPMPAHGGDMRPRTNGIGALLLAWSGLAMVGCASDYPGRPTVGQLAMDLSLPQDVGRLARGQRGDDAGVQVAQVQLGAPKPPGDLLPAVPAPPPPGATPGLGDTIAPPPGTQQTSFNNFRSKRAPVRAWVNGRPIFDEEVLLGIEMQNPAVLQQPDKGPFTQAFNQVLNNIIDLEVAYQEAVKKLEKGNPKALEKLRVYVDQDFEKQSRPIKKALPPERFAEFAPTFRRQIERQLIGMEYVRARVNPIVGQISSQDLKDYFDAHPNEFQKVATVKWQHVFIGINAARPTLAQSRDFAEGLLDQVQKGGDFLALMKFDDGDSKNRQGKGFGSQKGEVRPTELEPYLFERMKIGQVGLLELSTGVHLFRLVERVDAGAIPFNETVQTQIRNKLRNQIMDREFKRFVRELKARAVIEVEKGI